MSQIGDMMMRKCWRTWCAPIPTSCARQRWTPRRQSASGWWSRARKTLIWDRTWAVQRLRHQLREYFPAALGAFEDLDATDVPELPGKAPDRPGWRS